MGASAEILSASLGILAYARGVRRKNCGSAEDTFIHADIKRITIEHKIIKMFALDFYIYIKTTSAEVSILEVRKPTINR